MKTVILCGGMGTRIRDVADDIPKPMIPIGGLPILWHIMKYYAHFNHKEFVLCLGHKSEVIKNFFLNYDSTTRDFTVRMGKNHAIEYHNDHSEPDWAVTLAETGEKAMTGARVKRVQKYVGKDDLFMLTYGDGVGNVDLNALLAFHKKHNKVLTITGVRPPGRFGELSTVDGHVTGFNEKPQTSTGLINGGFFVCSRKFFDYLDDREDLVLEKEPMKRLVQDQQMMVFEHTGFWQPMDTAREYQLLNSVYQSGEAPWKIW